MVTSVLPEVENSVAPQGRGRFYYGWINLLIAALAMTATLPGRTHGLGLITKDLTTDPTLDVGESLFSLLNFWAILLGSTFCLPIGRMIDRYGVRGVLVGVAAGLGLAVLGMSAATGVVGLFVTLTLVRGLGQGALSVVSMALIGKWFTRRLPMAMAVFTVLLAFGFLAGNFAVGEPAKFFGWRPTWAGVGLFLLVVLAPLGALFARSTPESIGLTVDAADATRTGQAALNLTLAAALRSPGFWAFTLATSFFNLTWSAITLFNESILEMQGFNKDTFLLVMGVLVVSGLPANLLCGWLAQRMPMGRLLCAGMLLLAGSLAVFPFLTTTLDVVLYGAALGVSGGIITVVFFAVYGVAFGRRHLGAIQAAVQVVTVFASALGPVLLQWSKNEAGSFAPFFYMMAPVAAVLGLAVLVVKLPPAALESVREVGPPSRGGPECP
jgi:MFS family permease